MKADIMKKENRAYTRQSRKFIILPQAKGLGLNKIAESECETITERVEQN